MYAFDLLNLTRSIRTSKMAFLIKRDDAIASGRLIEATVVILLAFCSCSCAAYQCQQIDTQTSNCRCQFDDPDKTVIDFSPISRHDGHPEFPFDGYSTVQSDWTYAFNPCYPFDGPGLCKGKAVCQQSKSNPSNVFSLGDPVPTAWTTQTDDNTILVTYTTPDSGADKRTSLVGFTCDKTALSQPTLEFTVESPQKTYHFTVKTCYACLDAVPGCKTSGGNNLTTGGVICIIFTVLVVVYFVGGILFQKFGRGATGRELIPNHAFWSDFPALVKDGILFMVSPCRRDDGYSSI